jgi:hypothetical protein
MMPEYLNQAIRWEEARAKGVVAPIRQTAERTCLVNLRH